jgi:membrane protease YdiL (CAAX protease family)
MNQLTSWLNRTNLYTKEDKKPTVILLLAALLLTAWRYYGSQTFYFRHLSSSFLLFSNISMTSEWYTYLMAFFLLGAAAVIVIKTVFKENLSDYGLQTGDWKFWVPAVVVIGSMMAVLSYFSARDPQFAAEYPLFKGAGDSVSSFAFHAAGYLLFYVGWEIFFRGFMQFGLASRFGAWGAILVQTALSCIVHIGKPDTEIYSAILGGLVWGVLVYRSRSLYPAILTHWILGVSLDYFILIR